MTFELPSSVRNYPTAVSPELLDAFSQAAQLQSAINTAKAQHDELWPTIIERLRTDWTYHSCGIEGSTLTRGETHFFLSEGLTVEGKPFKDFLDAQNHAEAVDMLFDIVAGKQAITEGLIKEVNALLLKGISSTPARNSAGQWTRKAATPGQYKTAPNHVLQADGSIHHYVEPVHVASEMQNLVQWINTQLDKNTVMQPVHPIQVAAVAHYNMVRIHPFDDGNGRGARFLMNLILLHKGYFPAVVPIERKRAYLEALATADQGDLTPFITFIAETLIASQQGVLKVLNSPSP